MGLQRLNQTKSASASSTPLNESAIQLPEHPVIQLQAAIGNRGVNQWIAGQQRSFRTQQPIQAKTFQPLSQELMGKSQQDQGLPSAPTPGTITAQGEPLPAALRQTMENSFNTDFSDVRIHEGPEATAIGALAYTRGSHIHFAPGQYNPISKAGRQTLSHELTHVIQQRAKRVMAPSGQAIPINTDPALEHEADVVSTKIIEGQPVTVVGASSNSQLNGNSSVKAPIQRVGLKDWLKGTFKKKKSDSIPALELRRPPSRHSSQELGSVEMAEVNQTQTHPQGNFGAEALQPDKQQDLSPGKVVIDLLLKIPFLEKFLTDAKYTIPQGDSLGKRIGYLVSEVYPYLFLKQATSREESIAILLSSTVSMIAQAIAREHRNPQLVPTLARELFRLYREDLEKNIDLENAHQVVKQASGIASSDPITLYLKNKISLEEAVWQVRAAAQVANITPAEMFVQMLQQFELSLAFTLEQVAQGTRKHDQLPNGKSAPFQLSNLIGELSEEELRSWVNVFKDEDLNETVRLIRHGEGWEIDFTNTTKGKIQQLINKVGESDIPDVNVPLNPKGKIQLDTESKLSQETTPNITKISKDEIAKIAKDKSDRLSQGSPHWAPINVANEQNSLLPPGLSSLSQRQYTHLRAVEGNDLVEAENIFNGSSPSKFLQNLFVSQYQITDNQADILLKKCVHWLEQVPLTITFKPDIFSEGAEPKYGSDYINEYQRSRSALTTEALLGHSEPLVENKPVKKSIAVYGDDKIDFAKDRGENYLRWRLDKDRQQTLYSDLLPEELAIFGAHNLNFQKTSGGVNHYGDCHFVLKDAVRKRAAMSWDTKGKERRSMLLILVDIAQDSRQEYRKQYIDAIVNNATNAGQNVGFFEDGKDALVHLETHIYGGLNLKADVAEIIYPNNLDSTLKENLIAFAKTNNIGYKSWDTSQLVKPAYNVKTIAADVQQTIQ